VLQPHAVALAVLVAELEQVAAGDRRHGIDRRQLHGADRVGFRIGDIERVAVDGDA
jgi:hypothetical protein